MILIGIHGKGGSGKDTVGDILRDKHDFAITSFAHPIKVMICGLLGVDMEKWNDRNWREDSLPAEFGYRSPRYMAQTIGTEWGRTLIDGGLWYNLAIQRLEQAAHPRAAVTDVRFDNEANELRSRGGYVIIVHRNASDLADDAKTHASEVGLRRPGPDDFHINNFGSLEDLERQVDDVVEKILKLEEEKALEEVQGDDVDSAGADD